MPFYLVETESVTTNTRRVEADTAAAAAEAFAEGVVVHSAGSMEQPALTPILDPDQRP